MDHLDKIVARYRDSKSYSEELMNFLQQEKAELRKSIKEYEEDLSRKDIVLHNMSCNKQKLSQDVKDLKKKLNIEEIEIEGLDNGYNEIEISNPYKNVSRLLINPDNISDQILKVVAEIRILDRRLSKLEKVWNDKFDPLQLDNEMLYSDKIYLEGLLEEKRQKTPRYNVVELGARQKKEQKHER